MIKGKPPDLIDFFFISEDHKDYALWYYQKFGETLSFHLDNIFIRSG